MLQGRAAGTSPATQCTRLQIVSPCLPCHIFVMPGCRLEKLNDNPSAHPCLVLVHHVHAHTSATYACIQHKHRHPTHPPLPGPRAPRRSGAGSRGGGGWCARSCTPGCEGIWQSLWSGRHCCKQERGTRRGVRGAGGARGPEAGVRGSGERQLPGPGLRGTARPSTACTGLAGSGL